MALPESVGLQPTSPTDSYTPKDDDDDCTVVCLNSDVADGGG